jgi:hypothetical protein
VASEPTTTAPLSPESGYGRTLRRHGLMAEAWKMDELVHRARMCDAHCGGRDAEIERLQAALRRIENINNGPDQASGEYRCLEAAAIAREALS